MADHTINLPPAPPPAFVARDEREQLIVVFSELVRDRGFEHVTLELLADEAGVPLDTVRGHFASPEDCVIAASEVGAEQMFAAAAAAFLSTPGDCPLAARAALDAMLRFSASMPAMLHVAVLEHGRVGLSAIAARRKAMDMFAELLGPGFAVAGENVPQPELLATLIGGGIYDLVSKHCLEGRLEQLPDALPAVTYFTVAPFFGVEEALRVASLPAPATPAAG